MTPDHGAALPDPDCYRLDEKGEPQGMYYASTLRAAVEAERARLDFMCAKERFIEHDDKGMWRVYEDVAMKGDHRHRWEAIVIRWSRTSREAIDSAIRAAAGRGETK